VKFLTNAANLPLKLDFIEDLKIKGVVAFYDFNL
jgi:hypothetical protein